MTCVICGRKEGDEVDIAGEPDGIPLGPVAKCETCGRYACPECLHETDCCFVEADDHCGDPAWAPPGWKRLAEPGKHGETIYERTNGSD